MSKLDKYKNEVSDENPWPDKPNSPEARNREPLRLPPNSAFSNPIEEPGQFLFTLLHLTIFFSYFEYIAQKHFQRKFDSQKIIKLKAVHPIFFKFCIFADYSLRICATGMLLWSCYRAISKLLS